MTEARDPQALFFATDTAHLPALQVLAERLADMRGAPETRVIAPGDGPGRDPLEIAGFLASQAPGLIVLAGDQLPGSFIDHACARGITLMLVEAVNPTPIGRRRLIPGATRSLLSCFAAIHTRDAASSGALKRLLRSEVRVHDTGPLARFLPARGCNEHELDEMRLQLGARPVWFAQDLPADESESILLAHAHALRRAHRLLLIAQPRDPLQGAALAVRAQDVGFSCTRRMMDDDITETTQVYIADAEDEPGLFLRLAPVTYLGGTLTEGADTPSGLAAAALGSALLVGPNARPEHAGFIEALVRRGGARRIGVPPALGEALTALLSPETGADAALKAWDLATEGSAATEAVARAIVEWARGQEGA